MMDSHSTRTSKPTIMHNDDNAELPSDPDWSSPLRRTLVPSSITRVSKRPITYRALNRLHAMLVTSHRGIRATPRQPGLTCQVKPKSKQITRPQVPDNTIFPSLPGSVGRAKLQESTKQNLPRHPAILHSDNMPKPLQTTVSKLLFNSLGVTRHSQQLSIRDVLRPRSCPSNSQNGTNTTHVKGRQTANITLQRVQHSEP